MAIRVNKSELNLRDELQWSRPGKVGAFGKRLLQADQWQDYVAAKYMYDVPEPIWQNVYENFTVGQSNSYTFLDEGNRRVYLTNGNNGPNAHFRMKGVLRGPFELHYECSYLWGWAGVTLIPESNFSAKGVYFLDTNGPYWSTWNNNSNNQCYGSWKPYYGSPLINTTIIGGQSSGLFKIWRNTAGEIYYRPPTGTDYAMGSTQEDFFVINQPQSPSWVRLNAIIYSSNLYGTGVN